MRVNEMAKFKQIPNFLNDVDVTEWMKNLRDFVA